MGLVTGNVVCPKGKKSVTVEFYKSGILAASVPTNPTTGQYTANLPPAAYTIKLTCDLGSCSADTPAVLNVPPSPLLGVNIIKNTCPH